MPLRNPFNKERYTDTEYAQLEALQRFYTQDVAKDLHEFLQTTEADDRIPRYATTATDLERSMFQGKLGTGLLAMEAENLLVNVLQYQRTRHNRSTFRNGYANDTRNLLCEVIKHFVVNTLSHAEVSPDLLVLVDKWSNYIHHITMANVFRAGTRSEETMEAMLVSIRNSMRHQVRPTIVKKLASATAREHIQWFIQSAKKVLSHGAQFLYFVLRDTENTPRNCTVPNMQVGHPLLEKVLQTNSGRLLQAMVLSTPFQQVFPIGYVPGGISEIAEQLLLSSISNFGVESGKVLIPPLLAQLISTAEKEKERERQKKNVRRDDVENDLRQVFPHVFLQGENSGVAKPFRDKRELLEEFVKLHELFIRIANLIQLLEQAHALAGEGGDLLVYGVTRKQIAGIVVDYTLLSNAVRDSIMVIEQYADGLYQFLVRENLQKQKNWKSNYLQVSHIAMLLNADLEHCHTAANKVRQQATTYALTMNKRVDNMKKALETFLQDSTSFSTELRSVLQLPSGQEDNLLEAQLPKLCFMDSLLSIEWTASDVEEFDNPPNQNAISSSSNIRNSHENIKDEVKMALLEVSKKGGNKKSITILNISPPTIPLPGVIVRISGNGFVENMQIRVVNNIVSGVKLSFEGSHQVITFRAPAFSAAGEKKLVITNPNGSYIEDCLYYK